MTDDFDRILVVMILMAMGIVSVFWLYHHRSERKAERSEMLKHVIQTAFRTGWIAGVSFENGVTLQEAEANVDDIAIMGFADELWDVAKELI